MSSTPQPQLPTPVSFLGGDGALVAGLKALNPTAQRAFFARYAKFVERVLFGVLGPDLDLGDVLQDVFVSAFRQVHGVRSPEALTAWVRTIAIGVAQNRIRAKKRNRWLLFFAPDAIPEQTQAPCSAEVSEALRSVYLVLEGLPAAERIAFSLRYIEDMTVPEIAAATGASESTVKRRVREAERLFGLAAKRYPALVDWMAEERVAST